MKEFVSENLLFSFLLIGLLIIGIYREWAKGKLRQSWRVIFCEGEVRLKNGNKYFARQIDVLLSYKVFRILDYVFRGFFIRQVLNPYMIFPLTIILFLFLYYKIDPESRNEVLMLFVTFMSILWYTRETYQLKTEQRASNKISRRSKYPFLAPFFKNMNDDSRRLKIKNTGQMVAIDVLVKIIDSDNKIQEKKLRNKIKYIGAGEDQSIEFNSSEIDDFKKYNFLKTILFERSKAFRVMIECREIIDKKQLTFEYKIEPEDGDWIVSTEKYNF